MCHGNCRRSQRGAIHFHLEIKVICGLNEFFININVYALSGVMVVKDAIVNSSALFGAKL